MLLFSLLLACVDPNAPIDPTDTEARIFEVPKGSSANGLGPRLVEEGLAPSEWQWKLFLRQTDASCLKAGRFEVRGDMSLQQLSDDLGYPVVSGGRDVDELIDLLAARLSTQEERA